MTEIVDADATGFAAGDFTRNSRPVYQAQDERVIFNYAVEPGRLDFNAVPGSRSELQSGGRLIV
ncbi:hypothetical protein [Bradyrhizobium sp. 199]|uniref:hypothetical protein n=1 Tax=Bradyrhizobium sp. 199 TaxID=2782664 RepID=UPI001FF91B02|nr:hypothetical protein [Bradyrhizobium sp. 199]MCK1359521.1 hypothetical protein [Bradyrhizobium sp. 199]